MINISINNASFKVPEGTTLAVAIMTSGVDQFRLSVTGESRGPLCGMGVCFECRVTIDGVRHRRSCNILAADGMEIEADE